MPTRMFKRTPKHRRRQLAKSELWLAAAVWAQRWADSCRNESTETRPFEEWGEDDRMHQLCKTYGLSGPDLAKVWEEIAAELERRAMRAGYDDAWVGVEDDWFGVT